MHRYKCDTTVSSLVNRVLDGLFHIIVFEIHKNPFTSLEESIQERVEPGREMQAKTDLEERDDSVKLAHQSFCFFDRGQVECDDQALGSVHTLVALFELVR